MDNVKPSSFTRRELLQKGALVLLLGTLPSIGLTPVGAQERPQPSQGADTGSRKAPETLPVEDLMREHGVLRRTLLVYEEIIRRLTDGKEFPPQTLPTAAGVIRNFIESYHEKLEEDFLFPRFEKAGKLVDLVAVLRRQHQVGRRVTDEILKLGKPEALKTPELQKQLADYLRWFIRMYRPHAAREDTVLFPAFHFLVTAGEYEALGEDFERKEQALFGEDGFEKMVAQVASLEKQLGLDNLAQFTPKI